MASNHHFGWVPEADKKPGQKLVWVHALSLGEVNGAAPVLKVLREKRPSILIAVSVTTDAGYDAAHRMLPFADYIFFPPLDSWPFINRALDRMKPELYVLTDTGFWPSMLMSLKERRIPAMVFNGRISEKSQARYKQIATMVKPLLQSFAVICMQSERGRTTIQELGAPAQRVRIVGDTKFDVLQIVTESERVRIRERFRFPEDGQVWVAGSNPSGRRKNLRERLHEAVPEIQKPLHGDRAPKIGAGGRDRQISNKRKCEIRSPVANRSTGQTRSQYRITRFTGGVGQGVRHRRCRVCRQEPETAGRRPQSVGTRRSGSTGSARAPISRISRKPPAS